MEDDRASRYEVLKPIGRGKFSTVFRAKKKSDGETVALKRISIEAMDPKSRNKVLKEVRLLESLDHPNIVSYLDSYLEGSELVIVFEWAAAGDLKRQVRKAQERRVMFEERVIWKYFSQICEAIRHMHSRRVIHRDLKPANIFLTLEGQVKVGDLGLGRALSDNTMEAHSKVGTPLYMSPEVLRGDGYDWKSDVWSLGCLLYELAMLKSPFKSEGLNLYSLFQKINAGDYTPLPNHYSSELKQLAYKMISKDPADRPDMEEVCAIATEMRNVYANSSETAQSTTPQERQGQPEPDQEVAMAAKVMPEAPRPQQKQLSWQQSPSPVRQHQRQQLQQQPHLQESPKAPHLQQPEKSAPSAVAVALMDNIYDGLTVLNFQANIKIDRLHFAMDRGNRRAQFLDYLRAVAFLTELLGNRSEWLGDVDATAPTVLAMESLKVAETVGMPPMEGISPAGLVPGFGESVLTVLHWLTVASLRKHLPQNATPMYEEAVEPEEELDLLDDNNDGEEDEVEEDDQADMGDEEEPGYRRGSRTSLESHATSPALTVDPALWRLELERVSQRLKRGAGALMSSHGWRGHLDTMRSSSSVCSGGRGDELLACLLKASEFVSSNLQEISRSECRLNAQSWIVDLRQQHAALSQTSKAHIDHIRELQEEWGCLEDQLDSTQDSLQTARERVEERGGATDAGRLQHTKAGLSQLKQDIKQMDLQLGVKNSALWAFQQRAKSLLPDGSSPRMEFEDEGT
jgi:serine/threonine protein kinase